MSEKIRGLMGVRIASVLYSLTMANLIEQLQNARVYDLGQPYFTGMPHYPTHPPFLFGLTKKHGDIVIDGGVSSSADAMALGTHVGTHIDALCHFSCGGKVHGGVDSASNQSHTGGMKLLSVDTIAPILRRGVLLDIAGNQGMDKLLPDFCITPEHLEKAAPRIGRGDVVLLRTGWGAAWEDAARYVAAGPGAVRGGAGGG